MVVEGVDYSDSRPNLDMMWELGKRFVCRYLAFTPNAKVLTGPERKALHDKGFTIVLNWEQASGDMLKGYSRGRIHATEALRQARYLGAPDDVAIYFSCDVDAPLDTFPQIGNYLRACVDVLGYARVGLYGKFSLINAMVPALCRHGWQSAAWSHGSLSPNAQLYQHRNNVTLGGGSVDLDTAYSADFGGWVPTGGTVTSEWTQAVTQNAGRTYLTDQQRDTVLSIAAGSAADALKILVDKFPEPVYHANAGAGGVLSDADRQIIVGLTDAVNALNQRLASP